MGLDGLDEWGGMGCDINKDCLYWFLEMENKGGILFIWCRVCIKYTYTSGQF